MSQRVQKKYNVSTEDVNYSTEFDMGVIIFLCKHVISGGYEVLEHLSIEEAKLIVEALNLAIKDAEEDK